MLGLIMAEKNQSIGKLNIHFMQLPGLQFITCKLLLLTSLAMHTHTHTTNQILSSSNTLESNLYWI